MQSVEHLQQQNEMLKKELADLSDRYLFLQEELRQVKACGEHSQPVNPAETQKPDPLMACISELFNLLSQRGEAWECTVTLQTPVMALSWRQQKDSKLVAAGDSGRDAPTGSDFGKMLCMSEYPENPAHRCTLVKQHSQVVHSDGTYTWPI